MSERESDPEPVAFGGRESVLNALESAIEECERKAVGEGRIRDVDREKCRISYFKALAYVASTWRDIQNDEDLSELNEKIEQLREAQNRVPASPAAVSGNHSE